MSAPDLPDYSGACVANIVPTLLEPPADPPAWLPEALADASQVVLLVLDGLGHEQLVARPRCAPMLTSMEGGAIHTVVPSTTATALTSIATGVAPGLHGVVGYRIAEQGEVLNILRWTTPRGDARSKIAPEAFQTFDPFCAHRPPIVTRSDFAGSGFTRAHLRDTRPHGYRVTSTMLVELRRLLAAGEPFVYAYYEGLDKVAHEYGLGEHYDEELLAVDHLVASICEVLPRGAALAVTADHGQVEVGDAIIELDAGIRPHLASQSGEGRFRWLHARPGRARQLYEAAQSHRDVAWVLERDVMIEQGWFGREVTDVAARRLGDVALVARAAVSFDDPADSGPFKLIGRHGSVTSAEMRVPLLAYARM
ncbi:MAG: alkaline phosphatase family protein [Actinobacteria bacterium]|nr:alkaline phosphatase family protein [Actinomycetota bacterium]